MCGPHGPHVWAQCWVPCGSHVVGPLWGLCGVHVEFWIQDPVDLGSGILWIYRIQKVCQSLPLWSMMHLTLERDRAYFQVLSTIEVVDVAFAPICPITSMGY